MGSGTTVTAQREFSGGPMESPAELDCGPQPLVSGAVQEESPAANPLLEDLRRRLMRALQRTVARWGSRRAREAAAAAEAAAEAAALEEQSRARVESALGRLRAELLEMRFQNHQLARTLLDLNTKMQQLKTEHELEIASESQSLEDNAVNQEHDLNP
ncbi:alanine- and arginine-rich domain-containing protein [Ictidomys tridecemlineatus]|uniref:alanine and arginine-rich domain-containing protein n=1 Tax=Ictidomys tridecemlineatus TaxID=43179 RepID=UPI00038C0878|nr:alanine and arginine-rich domain-containing protein [Ictidomys tridecemlineatus]